MQSEEWEEFAIFLQLEEWNNATDRNTNSPDTPDLQAVPADLGGLRLLGQHSSDVRKQHSGKLLTEQQLRQDEELARQVEQSLQIVEWSEVKVPNTISHFTQDFPATAADRKGKPELQLYGGLSQEQKQHSEKLVAEQQLWNDEELAWRMEHGSFDENQLYDLFFAEWTDDRGYVGVGSVIKDSEGQVVFEHRECIGLDISHYFAEYLALINGLDVARSIGLRHINAYGIRAFIYWEVQRHVEAAGIVEQFDELQEQIKKLDSFSVNCLPRTENQDAIKLAIDAANNAQRTKRKSGLEEDTRQQCLICLENIFPSDLVCQKVCHHGFCFDCLSQHVETEVSQGKVPVRCPQFVDCGLYMDDSDCKRLVSPKVFDTYSTRVIEATISDFDKVYCPFPGCSALMCRTSDNKANMNVASSSRSIPGRTIVGSAECMECHRLFCAECNVPWHADLNCEQYQTLPPDERAAEDRKLFQLAADQKWRRCGKCSSMIILAEGCFHMTCRCGNEFCYTCGTNYQKKKKMCDCELFSVGVPRGWRLW